MRNSKDKMKNSQQRENSRVYILSFAVNSLVLLILIFIKLSFNLVDADFMRNVDFRPVISENSTVLFPTNDTQNARNSTFHKSNEYYKQYPWYCLYTNDLEENENESEGYCEGKKLTKIPQNLPNTTSRLIVANAKLTVLREGALKVYSSSLKDL